MRYEYRIDIMEDIAIGYFGIETVNRFTKQGVLFIATRHDNEIGDTVFLIDDNGLLEYRTFDEILELDKEIVDYGIFG